ncbi:hypothetical protein N5C66_27920 [Rhizobium pusense]|uniref:hypothetical protein n=1 Tax=Agrobacterium pusense TaxID=648995 RepID=UPI002446B964|nr:hypothetical protein [Agrobacterium pusense]MDH1099025.1 hypothetical protein [Agrobacterium pusense]MDH1115527.1 hypothetical protein [Agrobacterium pusense]MDH2197165.1 hypothetical protein [Agrobacterium pusense]
MDDEISGEAGIVLPLTILEEKLSAHLLSLPVEKRAAAIARFARIGFEKKSIATAKRGLGDPPGNVALVDFLGGTIRWFA